MPESDDLKTTARELPLMETAPDPVSETESQLLRTKPFCNLWSGAKDCLSVRTFLLPLVFVLLHLFGQLLGIVLVETAHYYYFSFTTTPSVRPPFSLTLSVNMTYLGMILAGILLIPLYLRYLYSRERAYPGTYLKAKPEGRTWLSMLFLTIFFQGLTNLMMLLIQSLSDSVPFFAERWKRYEEVVSSLVAENSSPVLLFITVVLFAPVMEELLFRGIMLGEFQRAMSPALAIVLQSLAFGFFHGNMVQGSYAFILGIVLGFAYWKSRSILLPILLHMVFNFFGGFIPSLSAEDTLANRLLVYGQLAFLALGFVYGLFWLVRRGKQPAAVK